MKLTKVRITEFQSIQDSTEFEIGDVTCLVGKNEAGKTALLKALYRLNPIVEGEGHFDTTDDYPRRSVNDYEDDVAAGNREPATVVKATYRLDPNDVQAVIEVFGSECVESDSPHLTLSKGYSNDIPYSAIEVNADVALRHLVETSGLPMPLAEEVQSSSKIEEMVQKLADAEQTEAVQSLTPKLQQISEQGVPHFIYDTILHDRIPKFLYFDEYYRMKGQDNLDTLRQRVYNKALEGSDHPLLGLIDLAGLKLDQLVNPGRTETLIARLEAAENQLTQRVLRYWSQNQHLRMKFDIRPAQPEDGPGMTAGTNIWGRVQDTKHMVTTPLGTRSRGFVWFFSFLAWYSKLKKEGGPLILLLDEPGLSLHAKAQGDLLHYFEEELKPHHQLVYTTHSPFMVDPTRFDRVRIVQNLSVEADSDDLPEQQQGTKVFTDVLEATSDSLFPLQGALGYEINQTLFVGPNSLVVEGVSDLLYIQTMSALLQEKGKVGLNSDWTITPVGGSDKVPTFVALIGAQTNLNVAVFVDFQKKDRQGIENLYKKKLLNKKNVITFADFVENDEADIEDMFNPDFYLKLVNKAFGSSVALANLPTEQPRIIRRIEGYLKNNPFPNGTPFNHYRPARYFSENIGSLAAELSEPELDRFEQAFKVLNALLSVRAGDPRD